MAGAVRLLGPDGAPLERPATLGQRMGEITGFDHRGPLRDAPYDGASRTDPDLAAFEPFNYSPQSALTLSHDTLVARLHDMARNDGWASVAVGRQVDSIVGAGWTLRSRPHHEQLGISLKDSIDLARQIEDAWREYAANPLWCDAGQTMNFSAQLALGMRHRVLDGEALAASLWLDRGEPYRTCSQVIHPDRLSNPMAMPDMWLSPHAERRQGVEFDSRTGAPQSYYIRKAHPGDVALVNPEWWRWEKVSRRLPNGRWQIVHAFEKNAAGAMRGEPPLAPIIHKLHLITKYDLAEIQAAVINAVFAALVSSPNDPEQVAEALSGGEGLSKLQDERIGFYRDRPLKVGGAQVNFLYPTDKVDLTRPNHPNAGHEPFVRQALGYVAASAGLMYEQLTGDLSRVNYSSFRGGLIEVYKGFTARQANYAAQFAEPLFENWLEEAIEIGKVKLGKGWPDFRDARHAYAAARWIGPAKGWIDPLKEAEAAGVRIGYGLSTFEKECAEQGEWYLDVFRQRARERAEMEELGLDPDMLMRPKPPAGQQVGPDRPPPAPPENKGEEADAAAEDADESKDDK
jgi:lambda family phage portal protein